MEKIVLITGANKGIGLQVAKELNSGKFFAERKETNR